MKVLFSLLLILVFALNVAKSQSLSENKPDSTSLTLTRVKVLRYHLKGRTATGQHTRKIKEPFVALSRDLLAIYPLGSYIQLSNCDCEGTYRVLDKMGKRHTTTVDVYSKKRKRGIIYCDCRLVSKT